MTDNQNNRKTRELLLKHCNDYPALKAEDIFKFLFQSAYGCEHLVSDGDGALKHIKSEYETLSERETPDTERLDGEYSRVNLSCLKRGLSAETLARLFCLSAKSEPNGNILLESKLKTARELVLNGELPISPQDFDKSLDEWANRGYPALHHSEQFRREYKPAYRVIAKKYADFIPVFSAIDKLLARGNAIIAIEGGSASGKTTLSQMLSQIYDCNVFHMDDYFLRPEQRTAERLAEVGGNIDRERFAKEILLPLKEKRTVEYRPYDCGTQSLLPPVTALPKRLTVIEGVYSMHPAFEGYYDTSVFLDIDPDYQRARISVRNSPDLAARFFAEWIPLEAKYFSGAKIRERANIIIPVED